MVNFVEVFICCVGAMFGEEEYAVWGGCNTRACQRGFLQVTVCFPNWGSLASGKVTCVSIWRLCWNLLYNMFGRHG